MRRYLPILFPAVAVVIIVGLAVRWYRMQTASFRGKISSTAQTTVQLSPTSRSSRTALPTDLSLTLSPVSSTTEGMVTLRYAYTDTGADVSVQADLPSLTLGEYQVFIRQPNAKQVQLATRLQEVKGGFIGSFALPKTLLPIEVLISSEKRFDGVMEQKIFFGLLPAESTR